MTEIEETCGIVTKENGRIRVRFKSRKQDTFGEFWPVQLKMEWFGVYDSDKEETVGVLVKENGRVRLRLKNTVQYTDTTEVSQLESRESTSNTTVESWTQRYTQLESLKPVHHS